VAFEVSEAEQNDIISAHSTVLTHLRQINHISLAKLLFLRAGAAAGDPRLLLAFAEMGRLSSTATED
jgi:hypothetical protein